MKTRLRSTNRRTSERRILAAFRAAMGLRGCRPGRFQPGASTHRAGASCAGAPLLRERRIAGLS